MPPTPDRHPRFLGPDDAADRQLGGTRLVKLTARDTAGDLYLVEGRMPPGSGVPLHRHSREDEIFHVLAGRVELTVGDDTREGGPGDVAYLPRGVAHAIRVVGDAEARVLNYVFPGANFEAFAKTLAAAGPAPTAARRAEVAAAYGIEFL